MYSHSIKNKKIQYILNISFIYIYAFHIIYMPAIPKLIFGISNHVVVTLILIIMGTPYVLKCMVTKEIRINKKILYLILGIFISSIYFSCRAILANADIRILQNNFIIVQILNLIIIVDKLKKMGYRKSDFIKFILNLGLIQGIICIFMLIIPEFKEFAVRLYYIGGAQENIFVSSKRIYGLSGDYTYFTPILHGIMATLAYVYSIFYGNKYLLYIPFILLSILLNGRMGLIIFIIGVVSASLVVCIRNRNFIKMIKFILLFIVCMIISLNMVRIYSPDTYKWIESGVLDTYNLLMYKEVGGNYNALLGDMLYFPKGDSIIWGEGHRVFTQDASSRGYIHSDIGYVNDMFMGGLIYLSILYLSIIKFITVNPKSKSKNNYIYDINSIMKLPIILSLMAANYKGECMRGGNILLGIVFIKIVLIDNTMEN